MKQPELYWVIAGALALAVTACGEDGHDHSETTPAEDACEHMAGGPSAAVTAIDDMTGDPADIGEEHTRFDIALVGDASMSMAGGYVDLVVAEEGEYHLFLDRDVAVAVSDSTGGEVAAESTDRDVTECSEVALGHLYDLGVGTYLLDLGPTDEETVSIVVVHAGAHDHE